MLTFRNFDGLTNLRVDGARDAVVKLGIQLGQLVAGKKSKVKLASIFILRNRFMRYFPSDSMCDIRCQENESMNTSHLPQAILGHGVEQTWCRRWPQRCP